MVDHILALDTEARVCLSQTKLLGAIFSDIEAACDTVLHHDSLTKLFSYGVRDRMGSFVQIFLPHRCFRVRVGSHLSAFFSQENGIVQGGVLSVALFAVLINNIATNFRRPLYVDYLAVLYAVSSARLVSRQPQLVVPCLEK